LREDREDERNSLFSLSVSNLLQEWRKDREKERDEDERM